MSISPMYQITTDMINTWPSHADTVQQIVNLIVQGRPNSALTMACDLAGEAYREDSHALASYAWRLVGMLQMHIDAVVV